MSFSIVRRYIFQESLLFSVRRVSKLKQYILSIRNKSQVATFDEELDPNAPVRFSTSRAAQWKAKYRNLEPEKTTEEKKEEFFRSLSYFVSLVGIIFYILIREGNDWDDELDMPLGKRMLSLQEWQLRQERAVNVVNNDDTDEIDAQLRKIAKLRKEYKYDD